LYDASMRTPIALVSLVLLASCRTATVPKPTKAPPDEVLQLQGATSEAAGLTTSLCDSVGPRLAGSPGDPLAVAWAVQTMTKLGLQNVHTEPVTVPTWVRGVEEAEVLSPKRQPLNIAALGGSIATPDSGVEGEVLEVNSLDALKKLSKSVADKDKAKGKDKDRDTRTTSEAYNKTAEEDKRKERERRRVRRRERRRRGRMEG
jgi:hypothetical protein